MFVVDESTAEAIRLAWEDGGELSAVVELRRYFPLITDNARARWNSELAVCSRALEAGDLAFVAVLGPLAAI